ncbi:hypothetical protein SpCBS45565_g07276 [Spizellomyces sp. 'palustris']|nr:hypothetical protein SpCBS45565_g07276 [Spizellomyces sp. 'palustris']
MLSGRRPSLQVSTSGTGAIEGLLSSQDYKEFSSNGFDATQYANRVIQAPADSPFHGMDIATALAKLNFGIEHLNKHIHDQVASHYEDLLQQVTGLSHIEEVLATVKIGLGSLNGSFDRVREKIVDPYQQMRDKSVQLDRIQRTAEVLRRIIRFMYLLRRLELLMPGGERELPKAALTVSEMDAIIADEDLQGIAIIESESDLVAQAKERITTEGEQLLLRGLSAQTADIASGLQVFFNLGQLASKTRQLVEQMLQSITKDIQAALDVVKLNKEIKEASLAGDSARRPGDTPFLGSSASASNGLWSRLERLMDSIFENANKIYQLEKVLGRKRDPITHVLFLDEVNKGINGDLLDYFWKGLSASLEREIRLATKASQFLLHAFQTGYPRLLRLVHNVFTRLSVVSGIDYSDETQRPDSLLILRTLSPFEGAYLSRSLSRILEPVNTAFPERPGPGVRPVPSRDDVDKIIRALSSEMEVAKFDAHLLKAVSKNGNKAIRMYAVKCEQLYGAEAHVQFSGTGPASQSQALVIEIINSLWWMQQSLLRLLEEFDKGASDDPLSDAAQGLSKTLQNIVERSFKQITREMENVLMKMHREDFASRHASPSRGPVESSTSQYVVEFATRIRWLHRELLSKLQCGKESREWIRALGQRVVDFFLRHASLIRPSNEVIGRLLAGDMTQLEFVLSQWFGAMGMKLERDLGDSYRALRTFRHLPFLDLDQVRDLSRSQTLPPLILLQHLLARSRPSIPSPMLLYGWSATQYSEWLDLHSTQEAMQLLDRCLDSYADDMKRRGDRSLCPEFNAAKEIVERNTKK